MLQIKQKNKCSQVALYSAKFSFSQPPISIIVKVAYLQILPNHEFGVDFLNIKARSDLFEI